MKNGQIKVLRRGAAVTAAAVLLTVPLVGPSSAQAALSAAACSIKSYDDPGFGEVVERKGNNTPKYNNGYTDMYGRRLSLVTGRIHDRSAGRLEKAKKGDKVWVHISHDKGKTWQVCGEKTAGSDGTLTSKWFIHDVSGRWIRACASNVVGPQRVNWCADVGNKTSKVNGVTLHWWSD